MGQTLGRLLPRPPKPKLPHTVAPAPAKKRQRREATAPPQSPHATLNLAWIADDAPAWIANDDLGKCIRAASTVLQKKGWRTMCEKNRGRTHVSPNVDRLPHPAAPMLHRLHRHGAPVVTTTPPWSLKRRDAAMARGSHASTRQYYEFLCTEMADMARLGYWTVIPYRLICRLLKRLRLSPAGVIPQ